MFKKKSFLILLILPLLVLVITYLSSPWWIEKLIRLNLPENIHLQQITIQHATYNSITISHLKLALIDPSLNKKKDLAQLFINKIKITFNWNQFEPQFIHIDQIKGQISQLPQTKEDSNKNTIEPFTLPPIQVDKYQILFEHIDTTPVTFIGKLLTQNKNLILESQLFSAEKLLGKLAINYDNHNSIKLKANINAQLDSFTSLLNQYLKKENIPLTQINGAILLNLETDLFLAKEKALPTPNNSKLSLTLNDIEFKHEDFNANKFQATININQNEKEWLLTPLSIAGEILVKLPHPQLNNKLFHLTSKIQPEFKRSELLPHRVTLDTLIEHQQSYIKLKSNISRQNNLLSGQHQAIAELRDIHNFLPQKIPQLSIKQLKAEIPFSTEFEKESLILMSSESHIKLQQVEYKDEQKLTIKMKEADIKLYWPQQNLFEKVFLEQGVITSNETIIESAQWPLLTTSKQHINLKQQEDKIYYHGESISKYWNQESSSESLLPKLSFEGHLSLSDKTTQTKLGLDVLIRQPQETLALIFPQKKALLNQIQFSRNKDTENSSSENNSSENSIRLLGQLNIKSLPESKFKASGYIESQLDKITIAKNALSQFRFKISLLSSDNQSSLAHLTLSTYAELHNQERQEHNLESQIIYNDQLYLKDLILKSKLLNGELIATANKSALPIMESKGQVEIKNINLAAINQLMNKPELTLAGSISGKIPFQLINRQLTFKQGALFSQQGKIQYLPDGKKVVLTQDTLDQLANITLQNFHYTLMEAEVISGNPCAFDIKFKLNGHNPDISSQSNQTVNIGYNPTSNVNIYYLLLFGEDFIKELDDSSSVCVQ